jgi:redox-sensitive bicupin YhaK (pirin superfamily)
VKLLQIWLFPDKLNHKPRYQQISLQLKDRVNRLQQIVSPSAEDDGAWIHQDAWFFIGKFDTEEEFIYQIKKMGNGAYVFLFEGTIQLEDKPVNRRDGVGIWDTDSFKIKILSPGTELLIMDIPMH